MTCHSGDEARRIGERSVPRVCSCKEPLTVDRSARWMVSRKFVLRDDLVDAICQATRGATARLDRISFASCSSSCPSSPRFTGISLVAGRSGRSEHLRDHVGQAPPKFRLPRLIRMTLSRNAYFQL